MPGTELLAPLGCGVTTGAGAVLNAFEVGAGSSIAVFGTGVVRDQFPDAAKRVNG